MDGSEGCQRETGQHLQGDGQGRGHPPLLRGPSAEGTTTVSGTRQTLPMRRAGAEVVRNGSLLNCALASEVSKGRKAATIAEITRGATSRQSDRLPVI